MNIPQDGDTGGRRKMGSSDLRMSLDVILRKCYCCGQWPRLEQHCPIELSAMMELFFHLSVLKPQVAIENLKCG